MPRAEIPEGAVEAGIAAIKATGREAVFVRHVLEAAAPILHAHWLEQLKEKLGEPVHTLASAIGRARMEVEVLEDPPAVVSAARELELAADAMKQLRTVLSSIPIEEGGS